MKTTSKIILAITGLAVGGGLIYVAMKQTNQTKLQSTTPKDLSVGDFPLMQGKKLSPQGVKNLKTLQRIANDRIKVSNYWNECMQRRMSKQSWAERTFNKGHAYADSKRDCEWELLVKPNGIFDKKTASLFRKAFGTEVIDEARFRTIVGI